MKNVLFYLIPKSQVVYLTIDMTIRQTLEKMKFHRYSSVPVINNEGEYVWTVTEGDILWYLIENNVSDLEKLEDHLLKDIVRKRNNDAININYNQKELVNLAINQNFVPVVDDQKKFIGIVTRKTIIKNLKD